MNSTGKPHQPSKNAIRELTRAVYDCLKRDEWPSQAACVDFGITSEAHLGALQYAVASDGVTLEQLDAALGNGSALQALISSTNPYRNVVFRTDWGDMPEEPEDA